MSQEERIEWMAVWCAKHGLKLELEGQCGIGRECVGVSSNGNYPDYNWYDDDFNRIDQNGDVWIPEDAYHKHPCVAVLGRGEDAEKQLYDWLKWFEKNGFILEVVSRKLSSDKTTAMIEAMMGKHNHVRLTRTSNPEADQ